MFAYIGFQIKGSFLLIGEGEWAIGCSWRFAAEIREFSGLNSPGSPTGAPGWANRSRDRRRA